MPVIVTLKTGAGAPVPNLFVGLDAVDLDFLGVPMTQASVFPEFAGQTVPGQIIASGNGVRAKLHGDWPTPVSLGDLRDAEIVGDWITEARDVTITRVEISATDYVAEIDFGKDGPRASTFILDWTEADLRALNPQVNAARGQVGTEDLIYGTSGADSLRAGGGNDTIFPGNGDDLVLAGVGDDIVGALDGTNTLRGGAGDDQLSGGSGTDWIFGGAHADSLFGNFGADVLLGGQGADALYGGFDNDTLRGGAGQDTIYGSRGDDLMIGGRGADVFVFELGDTTPTGSRDVIRKYDPTLDRLIGETQIEESGSPVSSRDDMNMRDRLQAAGVEVTLRARSVEIDWGEDDSIVVRFDGPKQMRAFWDSVTWDFVV